MPHLPKIALQRLQGRTSALNHPDADLLTAFAEKSLSNSERAHVTDHLASCRDCREIVALALPATEETTTAGVRRATAARTGWFLRWGGVAAGLTLAASIGIVQWWQRHSTQLDYSAQQRQEVAATTRALADHLESDRAEGGRTKNDVRPSAADQDVYAASNKDTDRAKFAPAAAPRVSPQPSRGDRANASRLYPGTSHGALGGSTDQGTKFAMAAPPPALNFAQSAKKSPAAPEVSRKQLPSRSSELATSSETVEVTAAAPVMQAEESTVDRQAKSELSLDKAQVAKAKPPVSNADLSPASAPAAAMEARAPVPLQSEVVEVSGAPAARWTISSSGALQRSVDAGKTWQDVNVNAPPLSSNLLLRRNAPPQTATVRAKKSESAAPEGKFTGKTVFRAVSAAGPEVWAGGMSGILYHSSDGGETWIRVIPAVAGVTLAEDIIAIEFTDYQNGKLTTSHPEVWTTTDAGQSWQKQ